MSQTKGLSGFINKLETAGELIHVGEFVSPYLEITEIADRFIKNNGKALLFENNGSEFPLLINAFGSERRICLALGMESLEETGARIAGLMEKILGPKNNILQKLKVLPALQEAASWIPRIKRGRGACQEVVMNTPDLTRLPVLTCWPFDGGPFITLPMVHTKDPATGIRNLGMYRMQVFGPDLTAMHWHLHKGSAHHFNRYREIHKKMAVTVTLGGDPVYTYAATAPLPENLDEYLFAGFLRKRKVELVRCLTNDLEVPSDVDFVIEGYIDPDEEFIREGPFGDHTGFYSLEDNYPRFHVTCITHRKNAVYPATVVGIPPMEDGWIGKATERFFLTPIRMTVAPEIKDINMPVEGVFHNLALVRIEKSWPGQGLKVMNSLWGAGQMMFNKIMIVTDGETDPANYAEVARLVSATTDPLNDVHFTKGPVDILDHSSSRFAFGSKMGIDATMKLPEEISAKQNSIPETFIDLLSIKKKFPAIQSVNDSLLNRKISVVMFSIHKEYPDQVMTTAKTLIREGLIRGIKFILFLDPEVDLTDLAGLVWLLTNNIDPLRDCFFINIDEDNKYSGIFIDGTRKTFEYDHFVRKWPNVIVMDDKTIQNVDEKWIDLGLGKFLTSPSLKYKPLVINEGASIF